MKKHKKRKKTSKRFKVFLDISKMVRHNRFRICNRILIR